MGEPMYITMEGLCDSSSSSEDEEWGDQKRALDLEESVISELTERDDDPNGQFSKESSVLALSKKQLNRLAAMDIYAIPSGGIGTVNASLFNPVTIQWLMKNFETATGSSLPRYLVYSHYLLHCKSLNLKPINAASFGKVIRSVFLGLQTRRLGTRGNSKYHYCGMRIKPDSPLVNIIVEDMEPKRERLSSNEKTNRVKPLPPPPPPPAKPQSTWHMERAKVDPFKISVLKNVPKIEAEGLTFENLKMFLMTGSVGEEESLSYEETEIGMDDSIIVDASFSSYFSASGYVTNYFSNGIAMDLPEVITSNKEEVVIKTDIYGI